MAQRLSGCCGLDTVLHLGGRLCSVEPKKSLNQSPL